MAKYLAMAKPLLKEVQALKVEQLGKDLNSHVDALIGLALVYMKEKLDKSSQ